MLREIISSIVSILRGFGLIPRLGLFRYFVLPGLISVGVLMGLFWGLWKVSRPLSEKIISWLPFASDISWAGDASTWISRVLFILLGLVVFKYILLIVVAPFMSTLSEQVERHLTGQEVKKAPLIDVRRWAAEMWRGVRLAVRNLLRELFFVFLLTMVSWMGPVAFITAILIFLVQAYYAGFGNIDYLLERHLNVKESVQFVRQHKGLAIGNGIVFILLVSTLIGAFFAPAVCTIGATLSGWPHLDKKSHDRSTIESK